MRPIVFSADVVRRFLLRNRVATLPQLKHLLGSGADITVFRKLKELSYRTSYSHRGSFYTLDEIASFDELGLWAAGPVHFSLHGTLIDTTEALVNQSVAGYFASELQALLHVPVKEPLLHLTAHKRIVRQSIGGLYLYCSLDAHTRRRQLLARNDLRASQPPASDDTPDSAVQAAIILFASTLDERQRRLFCGLESLQLGSDRQIASILQVDPHTVAKGRRQLLAQDVDSDRIRAVGGGRKPTEKKRLKSSSPSKS